MENNKNENGLEILNRREIGMKIESEIITDKEYELFPNSVKMMIEKSKQAYYQSVQNERIVTYLKEYLYEELNQPFPKLRRIIREIKLFWYGKLIIRRKGR